MATGQGVQPVLDIVKVSYQRRHTQSLLSAVRGSIGAARRAGRLLIRIGSSGQPDSGPQPEDGPKPDAGPQPDSGLRQRSAAIPTPNEPSKGW
jgi:hypothetical protein